MGTGKREKNVQQHTTIPDRASVGNKEGLGVAGKVKMIALHHLRPALERKSCSDGLLQDLQYQELREAEELGFCATRAQR